ncbi:DUF58 domain-containing protein [Georgenia sp. AZ-5]|uniref:DUF58 domain-containing protein n=1 Tax=Georgenia sp. AZ-5 TaxID=3367526 RepID=UPI003754CFF2
MTLPGLTTRGTVFAVAGVAAAVLALILGYPDITRIGVFLAALPVLSVLTSLRRTPHLAVRRTVSPAVLHPEEEALVRVEVRNTGRRTSLPFVAEEALDDVLGPPPAFLLPALPPGGEHVVTYRVRPGRRGVYRIRSLGVELEDPFGLSRSRFALGHAAEFLVLPRVHPLGALRLGRPGDAGEWPVPRGVAPQGDDDVSTRPYHHGDDLRRVHWPATAHRGELMVRQEERPARRRATLVLDGRASAHRGRGLASSFEWAVSAVASAAVHLAAAGWSLSLVTAETVREGTAGHVRDLESVLRELALAGLHPGDLEPVLRAAREVPAGAVVAAVADDVAAGRLLPARPRGADGVLLLLDTATFDGVAPAGRAEDAAHRAPGAGWRAAPVHAGDGVAAAWRRAVAAAPLVVAP